MWEVFLNDHCTWVPPLLTPLPLASHHSPSQSPLLLTPLTPIPITTSHHSPYPSSHHSPLTQLIIITPLHYIPSLLPSLPLTTPSHQPSSPTLLTTPPHHPLHHSPPYLPSSPHLLTTLFTTPLLTLLRLLTTPSPLIFASPPPLTPSSSPPLFKGTS